MTLSPHTPPPPPRPPQSGCLSSCHGTLPGRGGLCPAAALLLLLLASHPAAAAPLAPPTAWTTLENCTLEPWDGNDGDSFLVRSRGLKTRQDTQKVFRLYYVDTPESEDTIPERLEAQRAYWNLPDIPTVIHCGEMAKQFSKNFLDKGFRAHTRWEDALGRTQMGRHFALLTAGGQDLGYALVRNGLARVYGRGAELDGLKEYPTASSDDWWAALRQAEAQAKREKKAAGPIPARNHPVPPPPPPPSPPPPSTPGAPSARAPVPPYRPTAPPPRRPPPPRPPVTPPAKSRQPAPSTSTPWVPPPPPPPPAASKPACPSKSWATPNPAASASASACPPAPSTPAKPSKPTSPLTDSPPAGKYPPCPLHNPLAPRQKAVFPMIGKKVSNDWKNFSALFQRLEKIFAGGKREGFQPQRTQRTQKGREEGREGCGREEGGMSALKTMKTASRTWKAGGMRME